MSGESLTVVAQARSGPRHAAPKKPLFTRFHVPAGRAIAMAAMPTAVLMGLGFTPTLALADDTPTAKSLTADEYKDCVAAVEGDDASASASPSPSASASASDDSKGSSDSSDSSDNDSSGSTGSGSEGSSDSGSDDTATPTPTPSASATKETSSSSGSGSTATPTPSASESKDSNLLEDIGNALTDVLTGGSSSSSDEASASPSPSASDSATTDSASDTVKETTEKVTDTASKAAEDTSKTTEDTVKAAAEATKAAAEAADDATASPSPSGSSSADAVDPEDCPVATDAVGDAESGLTVADDPWTLKASSLLLKGADYKGVVEVKTASGKTKKVLKYVISGGTDIGDLHQLVTDRGRTYHVQAGKGTTSTITDGDTVMYTESISGNLLGLIPITFSPDSPPPLNIPLIYFTNVTVKQAAQYGGTLHVPGMHQYVTEGTS
ncbi:hypothetical protein ABZ896_40085 [Streptomyces sp. NPDC047072]|uniref:hypothetical protein n=1 Tax=Streptomyces sp. NPDC047072 TaxID=3154809 RepID=UPI0033E0501F